MSFIWMTRGKNWGFRFLRKSEFSDPLPAYDAAFARAGDQPEAFQRVSASADLPEMVALRFPDPLGRKDRSGRVIPHEFVVVVDPSEAEIESVEDGIRSIWPGVEEEYAQIWDGPPPTVNKPSS